MMFLYILMNSYLITIYIHSDATTLREKVELLYNANDHDDDRFISYDDINQIADAIFIFYDIDQEKYSVS